ncbi:MAG: mevalonate kinase [Flavobacteriaceae bacterium]|nr:mevalonate kinase [Flavobacteriaceae bacterium]
MKGPLFYAKILLFGEYGIVKDSRGLSIPYNFFQGALKIPQNESEFIDDSNKKLTEFSKFLRKVDHDLVKFDWEKMERDLSDKLYFDSSIPQGYGLGSSGALVASFYDRYALEKISVVENLNKEKLIKLKNIFAEMEGFFHGKSSGLDPLNSYLSLPILINSSENIQPTGIPSQNLNGKGAVFLLDSGSSRETGQLMSIFLKNMEHEKFNLMMKEKFNAITDNCVNDFLKGNVKSLFVNIKSLSRLVYDNFKPMIPSDFIEIWKKGIETNAYFLKLCGSGGGGYILGFTQDFNKTAKILNRYKLEVVYSL